MSANHKTSKLRWLWLIPVGLLLGVLVLVFAWWQYFKTTPTYSLAVLVDAAQRNDQAAFDRVVDLDRVIDTFITQATAGPTLGVTTGLVTPVRTQLQSLAPETSAAVKQTVKEEIRKRINELATSSEGRPLPLIALAMPFAADIRRTADKAQVLLNDGAVELVMELNQAGDWTVTSLRDQALATRVVDEIVKHLPGKGQQIDKLLPETLPKLPLP